MELTPKIKDTKCFVYYLCDTRKPEEVRYIGITVRKLHERLSNHLNDTFGKKKTTHKTNWISKVIKDGGDIGICILEECSSFEVACEREVELIQQYKALGNKLTNTTEGGQGSLGFCSEEKKTKIKTKLLGHKVDISTREKISIAVKSYWDKLSQDGLDDFKQKKKNISKETRAKMSLAKKGKTPWLGKKHSEESKVKMSVTKNKKHGNTI